METSYMKEEAGHEEFLAGENVFKAVCQIESFSKRKQLRHAAS